VNASCISRVIGTLAGVGIAALVAIAGKTTGLTHNSVLCHGPGGTVAAQRSHALTVMSSRRLFSSSRRLVPTEPVRTSNSRYRDRRSDRPRIDYVLWLPRPVATAASQLEQVGRPSRTISGPLDQRARHSHSLRRNAFARSPPRVANQAQPVLNRIFHDRAPVPCELNTYITNRRSHGGTL